MYRVLALLLPIVLVAACSKDTPHAGSESSKPGAPAPAPAPTPKAPAASSALLAGDFTTTPSGLKLRDVNAGDGPPVAAGDFAVVHYTGWLTDGRKFYSSFDEGKPALVGPVGRAPVLRGLNEGLVGMSVGGQRRLVVPPELGFGARANGPIPPNATLVFDVEVLGQTTPPRAEPMAFPDLAKLELTTNPSGLKWADLEAGTGPEIVEGSTALIHYTGWLENGTKFDSSVDKGDPYRVSGIPKAEVIAGWNEGLLGMKEGGTRVLVVPAVLAYQDVGHPAGIPPNATLVFEVRPVKVFNR